MQRRLDEQQAFLHSPLLRPLLIYEGNGISSGRRETDSLKTKDSRRVLDTVPSVCWTERETTYSKAFISTMKKFKIKEILIVISIK